MSPKGRTRRQQRMPLRESLNPAGRVAGQRSAGNFSFPRPRPAAFPRITRDDVEAAMNAPRPLPGTPLLLTPRERELLEEAARRAAPELPGHLPSGSERAGEPGREKIAVRCSCGGSYSCPAGGPDEAGALEAARLAHVLREREKT